MMSKNNKKKDGEKPIVPKTILSPYVIPSQILEILKEHSVAYLLCSVDYQGNVSFNISADNEVMSEGLKTRLLRFLLADQEVQQEMVYETLANNYQSEEPPDDAIGGDGDGDDDGEESV